jgi:hypothetical protein
MSIVRRPLFALDDSPTLKDAWFDPKYVIAVEGPVGSGKTSWAIQLAHKWSRMQKPDATCVRRTAGLVVRREWDKLEKTTLPSIFHWLPPEIYGSYNQNKKLYKMRWIDGQLGRCECDIYMMGLDNVQQALDDLGSLQVTWAYIAEARELDFKLVKKVIERTERYPQLDKHNLKDFPGPTRPGVILETNPPPARHWWVDMEKKAAGDPNDPKNKEVQDQWSFYRQPPGLLYHIAGDGRLIVDGENPKRENRNHIADGYYLRKLPGMTDQEIKVQLCGERGSSFEGMPVYPEYREALHYNPRLSYIPGFPIWRAWDFGRHPACLFIQPVYGRAHIIDELYRENMGSVDFGDLVLIKSRSEFPGAVFQDVGDPSGDYMGQNDDQTPFTILAAKGINMMPGHQDPGIRHESVRKGLSTMLDGRPIIQIGPKAVLTKEGFEGGYRYEKTAKSGSDDPIYRPKPEKNKWSNVMDALQYFAGLNLSDAIIGGGSDRGYTNEPDEDFDGFGVYS